MTIIERKYFSSKLIFIPKAFFRNDGEIIDFLNDVRLNKFRQIY